MLYGDDIRQHQLLLDHILAETRKPDEGGGETIDIWTNGVGHPDNHWWDCLIGCAVAGSICGALRAGQQRHDTTEEREEVDVPSWMLGGRP